MKGMKVGTISEWMDMDYMRQSSSNHVALATSLRTHGVSLFEMQIFIGVF